MPKRLVILASRRPFLVLAFSILLSCWGLTCIAPVNAQNVIITGHRAIFKGGGGGPTYWFTSISGGSANSGAYCIGEWITLNNPYTITVMRRRAIGTSSQTHNGAIYNTGVSSTRLATTTVNMSGATAGTWVNSAAMSYSASAGDYFLTWEEYSGGDSFVDIGTYTFSVNTAFASLNGWAYQSGTCDATVNFNSGTNASTYDPTDWAH